MSMTPDQIAELISKGYREKYGKLWPPEGGRPASDLQIEFKVFRNRITGPKCPGPVEAFWNLVNTIWNYKGSPKPFLRTPWADKMVRNAVQHKFLGIAGCASSGKSEFGAVWGILNFFASPHDTKVLLTSTSLKDSRQRIWGSVEEYWQAAALVFGGEVNLPGELVSASGLIRFQQNGRQSDRQGLALIAGDKSKAKESIGKLIGFKGARVILIADELPELSEALINAAEANLYSNPDFQMVGIGNPNSYYDPFGVFCAPKMGWSSITEESEEWETEIGYCIRFDGERSPNILAGKVIYPWMLTEEKLERYRERLGEKSLRYYRMVRGFWCPTGAVDAIYTEQDILAFNGSARAIWQEPPTMVAGFDPAFTNGGDRSILYFGKYGVTTEGTNTLEWTEFVELNEDISDKEASRSQQIISRLIDECRKRGVHPRHLAIDGTGAGKPFCDMVRAMWSGEFLEVNFGGAATDMAASSTDPRPSKEVYLNLVSEIWFVGHEYLRSNQLRGISPALARELTARTYETKARGKVQVEPKQKMRLRSNASPDCFVAGTKVLTRSGWVPIECIQEGDEVATPFGFSSVLCVHEKPADELVQITFSNRKTLCGTPNHRLYSENGWTPMEQFGIDSKAESVDTRFLWQSLNLLFTKACGTEFKQAVDTISRGGKIRRRDFFIDTSGASTTALFLLAATSIIKMAIGGTIASRIWSALTAPSTRETTCANGGTTQKTEKSLKLLWQKPSQTPQSGTSPNKDGIGTRSTDGNLGRTGKKSIPASASVAESPSCLGFKEPAFARTDATWRNCSQAIQKRLSTAFSAAQKLLARGIQKAKPAPVVVVDFSRWSVASPVKTYSLTLAEDNAYYANGVLVENCADAALLALHLCRRRLGMASTAKVKSAKEDSRPKRTLRALAGFFAKARKF